MGRLLSGKIIMGSKALILTWDGFQDQEVIYPYYRIQEEGITPVLASNHHPGEKTTGLFGISFETNLDVRNSLGLCNEYDMVILPGGVKALEKLRQETHVIDFLTKFDREERLIASTCHGAQLLISTGQIENRRIGGYYSIEDDIANAGAEYSRDPVTVDDNIISSPHYKDMGHWMKEAINTWKKNLIEA